MKKRNWERKWKLTCSLRFRVEDKDPFGLGLSPKP